MKFKTWKQFINNKNLNESEEPVDNSKFIGHRLDSGYKNDPKEYEKLQKFLDGKNKPDSLPKNSWFVMDEGTKQIWMNNNWYVLEDIDQLDDCIYKSKDAAERLASVVSGRVVSMEDLQSEGLIKRVAKKIAGYGKSDVSSDRMAQVQHGIPGFDPSNPAHIKKAIERAEREGNKEKADQLKQQFTGGPSYQKKMKK